MFRKRLRVYWVALRNVLVGSNLAALTRIRHPWLLLTYSTESLFLLLTMSDSRGIRQEHPAQILGATGNTNVTLAMEVPPDSPWFSSMASYTVDIVNLCILCRLVNPRVVFEIGTLDGYTALHFALNTGAGARIYTLDLPKAPAAVGSLSTTMVDDLNIKKHARIPQYCFEGRPEEAKITCLFGDSAQFDFRDFQNQVDLFFIDGAHSYEYVRSDTESALKCCHPGSVVVWHDFGRVAVNGVGRWLMEFSRTNEIFCTPGGSVAYMVVK